VDLQQGLRQGMRCLASGVCIVTLNTPAVFLCKKQKVVSYGTHSIYIADICEVLLANEKQKALVYADGGYHHV